MARLGTDDEPSQPDPVAGDDAEDAESDMSGDTLGLGGQPKDGHARGGVAPGVAPFVPNPPEAPSPTDTLEEEPGSKKPMKRRLVATESEDYFESRKPMKRRLKPMKIWRPPGSSNPLETANYSLRAISGLLFKLIQVTHLVDTLPEQCRNALHHIIDDYSDTLHATSQRSDLTDMSKEYMVVRTAIHRVWMFGEYLTTAYERGEIFGVQL